MVAPLEGIDPTDEAGVANSKAQSSPIVSCSQLRRPVPATVPDMSILLQGSRYQPSHGSASAKSNDAIDTASILYGGRNGAHTLVQHLIDARSLVASEPRIHLGF